MALRPITIETAKTSKSFFKFPLQFTKAFY
jgi:hypothetical protein